MAFSYDPQIEAALLAGLSAGGAPPVHPRGDWQGLRATIDGIMTVMAAAAPVVPGVDVTPYVAVASDGTEIALRWYRKAGTPDLAGSAALYLHGGGMICGDLDIYDPGIRAYVSASLVPILAVDYRLAPEHQHPVPVEDCYAALMWLLANAGALGVDPARVAIMGDSAGGGLAAGVSLLARDRGVALARQILIYPMLDDRNVIADPSLAPFASWSYDNNATGWSALLGDRFGGTDIPYAAAPARAGDLSGLARAYIEVGDLDIFRDEDIAYAGRLAAAGIHVELHVHPGAPHGFDGIAPQSDVALRALADRVRVLRNL